MKLFRKLLYLDEGKGIEKGAPEKRAFFRFWEIFWLKKYKMMAVNLMYFVANLIPMALAAFSYVLAVSMYFTLTSTSEKTVGEIISSSPEAAQLYTMGLIFVTLFFTIIPVYAMGPCKAGFMYIIKSFVKREPCFIWYDFMTKTRSNANLAIKASLINGFLGFLIMIDMSFVLAITTPGAPLEQYFPGWMQFFSTLILICLTVLFLIMMMYIYPMIVTFKLTLKQLYKNAMLLAFIRWLPNLGMLIFNIVAIAVPLIFIDGIFSIIVTLFVYLIIGMGFMSFVNTFYTYPALKKYMIDNYKADKSRPAGEAAPSEDNAGENVADADDGIIPDWTPPSDSLEDIYGEDIDEVLAEDENIEDDEGGEYNEG
ncbi:MAG: hypothetical protein E7385_03870 [Ruminococcaceae bacterium]|nr:hypothetical protein [Oscillospiraceae bacterium]